LPGYGRLQQLSLDANLGASIEASVDAPFELKLRLDRLDLSSRSNALRKLDLELQGTRRQHRLQLSASVDDQRPLQLALHGGFQGKHGDEWQGTLTQLALDNPEAHRSLRLQGEAAMLFARERWSVGPLNVRTHRADLALSASATAGKTMARFSATNPQIGQVLFELSAKTPDAWSFSAQTPWQGHLQVDVADLGWVNPLLGAVWQIEGKLKADLQLAGTPQYPLLNGSVDAQGVGVRHLDQSMNLRNGRLHADIRDSILKLSELDIESVLIAPPAALRRLIEDKEQLNSLTATPGRISATGHMKLGTLGLTDNSEQLHLDIRLDRLGVAQTPKQWLLLSGQSQLSWQQGKLGVVAKLDVDAAHWQLADLSRPQLSSDVVIVGDNDDNKTSVTPWNGDITIGMGRYFSFEGAGARGRLAGRVQVQASATDLPRASGSVNLVNGRYDAYGQQLTIERGIFNFQGLLENPALNILAMRRGMQVDAGVEITGFAQAPKIRLVSEPTVPDAEKLSWLVLGRAPDQEGSDASVLMGAVGAIFGNDMNSAGQNVKQTFGIDDLSVHSGTLGQGQNMNSRIAPLSNSNQSGQVLTVGRQLTKQLRLSYEQALGTTGNLVKLTFKLTNNVSLVGTSGSDSALDMFYSFAFGGKSEKGKQP
jgi:translocation and assembly module TamB